MFGGNVRLGDQGHFLLGKIFEANHPPDEAPEAQIFFDHAPYYGERCDLSKRLTFN
jgi:hypothetical protein